MKTVRDIYLDALTMERLGLTPYEIASRLREVGLANNFVAIEERVDGPQIALTFVATGQIIRFDGADWHLMKL